MKTETFSVNIHWIRCPWCARYFAIEHGSNWRCPYCAPAAIQKAHDRADGLYRSNAQLRGQVARLKKGGGR